jgi:hypothetical protein
MSGKSIAERLNQADLAINNAADPTVAPLLTAQGCDAAFMAQGRALWTAAREAFSRREALYGEQQELTRQVNEAQRAARAEFKTLAQLARVVFRDQPGLLVQMGVRGGTPRALPDLLLAGGTLFANVTEPTIAAALAAHGYTAERIAAIQAAFQTLQQANEAQEAAKGDTQQATLELQAAMRALDDWLSRFRALARVALREHPQYLEKLGVRVRS